MLIEHYAGAFPLWLAPVQAVVLPIADRHAGYRRAVVGGSADGAGCGWSSTTRQEKIGFKIREAQLQKVPYMLVVGDREAADGTVSVRSRSGGDLGSRSARGVRRRRARREVATQGEVVIAFEPRGMRGPRRDDRVRINERIRVREVRVIDETGQQLGIMAPQQALSRSPDRRGSTWSRFRPRRCRRCAASPTTGAISTPSRSAPVRPGSTRRRSRSRKSSSGPKVDEHDYQFKKKHIERFLAEGDKVKATVFFRGREIAHPEIGRRILERLILEMGELAVAENIPRMEGNTMHTILVRGRDAQQRRPDGRRRRRPAVRVRAARRRCRPADQWHRPQPPAAVAARSRTIMPKLKTHRGAAKRFKQHRQRQVHAGHSFKRHILTSKTTKRKRGCASTVVVSTADQGKLERMLPYK